MHNGSLKVTKPGKRVICKFTCDFCGCEFETEGPYPIIRLDAYVVKPKADSEEPEFSGSYTAICDCPNCGTQQVTKDVSLEEVSEEEVNRDDKIRTLKDDLDKFNKLRESGMIAEPKDPFSKICPKWGGQ